MTDKKWPETIPLLREDELVRERWSDCDRYCLGGWVAHVFNDGKYYSWDEEPFGDLTKDIRNDPRVQSFSKRLAKNLRIKNFRNINDFVPFFDEGLRDIKTIKFRYYPPSKKEVAKAWNKTVRSFGYTQTVDRR